MLSVAKRLSHKGKFSVAGVTGGVPGRRRHQSDRLGESVDMLVGTPGRLLQHREAGNTFWRGVGAGDGAPGCWTVESGAAY